MATCPEHSRLVATMDEIHNDVKAILSRMNTDNVKVAVVETELGIIKKIVYSMIGTVLTAVLIAVIGLVLVK